MMQKNKCLLLAAALLLTGLCLWDMFAPTRQFSAQENRMLAQKPVFSVQSVLDKAYMTAYEEYVTDQFPARNAWIRVKTGTEKAAGKKDANGVYFAAGNTLMERHVPEAVDKTKADRKAARLFKEIGTLKSMGIQQIAVMLVPSAAAVQPRRLPAFAVEFDQAAWLEQMRQGTKQAGAVYVDVLDTLKQHAEEDIYFGTDHHWNTLGAFYPAH